MRKWQKTWLTLLASSLAVGWIAQGEAALIKVEGVTITQAQPVQVIIVDSNGRIFEQTANFDPATGGIDIDTSWAGPNASIFIPAFGIGYIWYNGYWVNQEGYYWNGTQRVAVPSVPQWREHWSHYWQAHHHGGNFHGGDRWQGRDGGWDRGDRWQGRDGGWRGDQRGSTDAYQGGQAGTMRSTSGYQSSDNMPYSGQAGTMRSTGGFQGGQSDAMTPSGQSGAMRSAGSPQGSAASSGSMSSSSGQGGAMRSAGAPQGGAASSGSGMSGSSRSAK